MNRDEARGYLAAIFDGEGSCALHLGKGTGKVARGLLICNTDWQIVEATQEALTVLGIEFHTRAAPPHRTSIGKRLLWQVRVSGQLNLRHFLADVPIRSTKKATLVKAVASYTKRPYYSSLHLLRAEDSA